jgi:hypothetical protein
MFELVCQLTKSPAKREALQKRLHKLQPGEEWVEGFKDPETGTEYPGGNRDRVREFWFFTRPNAVIVLDEIADLYPAEGGEGVAVPETLARYCRMHRHLKDDFYGFIQHKADLVAKARRLVQTVLVVTNSTRENIFSWWMLKGIKWPIQFFTVRQYVATAVMDLPTLENITGVPTQETWTVWPNAKGFKCYNSFSAVGFLGWKKPAEGAASTDVKQPLWWRIAGFVRKSPMLFALCGAVLVAAYIAVTTFRALLDPRTASTLLGAAAPGVGVTPSNVPPVEVKPPTPPLQLSDPVPAAVESSAGTATNREPAERVLLVTPGFLRTTRRDYAIGDNVGGLVAARFLLDGVLGSDGTVQRYSVVFSSRSGSGQ